MRKQPILSRITSAARSMLGKALSQVGLYGRHGWRTIHEPFSGAWQRNIEEKRGTLLTYPTLYACISRISSDIGKLPFRYVRKTDDGIWVEAVDERITRLLHKPNPFQTEGQFREYWMLSKLMHGNTYVLKKRDEMGRIEGLYVLDPERVLPMVTASGAVYYQLQTDSLSKLPEGYPADRLIVPASEIIHDRCMTVFHPLIGVPPLAAAHWPALKNFKILRNATEFFANSAQPGGLLTGPAGMSEDDARRVKEYWEKEYGSGSPGKIAVIGADMKFTPFAMKSIDAQMIEQMRYSDEQICQPFGVPPFKVGIGSIPSGLGVDGVNQLYYADGLQTHIEHMETLLDDGLEINRPFGVELDLEPLLRMDEAKRAEVETKLVSGKIKTPDEGRRRFNMSPTAGGSTLWGQHQDYPLGMLENRAEWDPSMQPAQPTEPAVSDDDKEAINEAKAYIATQKALAAMRKAIHE